jgi:hypothetical protein
MTALIDIEGLGLAFEAVPRRLAAVINALHHMAVAVRVPRLRHPDLFTFHPPIIPGRKPWPFTQGAT